MAQKKLVDDNGLLYVLQKIKSWLGEKVDKESGKGLSTNDYTTAEKNKLGTIEEGADVNQNAIGKIAVGSTTITAENETDTLTFVSGANIDISASGKTITIKATGLDDLGAGDMLKSEFDTDGDGVVDEANKATKDGDGNTISSTYVKTSTVTNTYSSTGTAPVTGTAVASAINTLDSSTSADSGYAITGVTITNGKITAKTQARIPTITDTYSSTSSAGMSGKAVNSAITSALANITGIKYSVVSQLPRTGEAGTIYLIAESGVIDGSYVEYIYVNNAFERIGTTAADLTDYVLDSDITIVSNADIDKMVAGTYTAS